VKSHKEMLKIIRGRKLEGSHWLGMPARVVMPKSLLTRDPTVFQVGEGPDLLPTRIGQMTEDDERALVTELRCELKELFGLNIPEPKVERRCRTVADPPDPKDRGSIIITGGGTAARLFQAAEDCGKSATIVRMTEFTERAVQLAGENISRILEPLSATGQESSIIIFTALEFMSLLHRNEDEEMLKPKADKDGIQHFPGEAVPVTDSSYRRAYGLLKPILAHASKTPTVLLMPIPRFLNGLGCCKDTSHATNRGTEELREDSFRALSNGKNVLNKMLIADKIWSAKAMSAHPALRQHLITPAEESVNPDLGNYMPLQKYGDVLTEATDIAIFIREKNRTGSSQEDAAAPKDSTLVVTGSHRDQTAWKQRLKHLDSAKKKVRDSDVRSGLSHLTDGRRGSGSSSSATEDTRSGPHPTTLSHSDTRRGSGSSRAPAKTALSDPPFSSPSPHVSRSGSGSGPSTRGRTRTDPPATASTITSVATIEHADGTVTTVDATPGSKFASSDVRLLDQAQAQGSRADDGKDPQEGHKRKSISDSGSHGTDRNRRESAGSKKQ